MTVITIVIQYPERDAQGIKEALAMDCEKYGRGVRVVRVEDDMDRKEMRPDAL